MSDRPAAAKGRSRRIANREQAGSGRYHIIVRDLVLPWRIGVRRHEKERIQRVRINLDLEVVEPANPMADDYQAVTCYETIIEKIRGLARNGHVKLAETVAHQVASTCLEDPRAVSVTVRVEKLDAIHDAASVGVEISLTRPESPARIPRGTGGLTGKG